jgi:hypothetical protein
MPVFSDDFPAEWIVGSDNDLTRRHPPRIRGQAAGLVLAAARTGSGRCAQCAARHARGRSPAGARARTDFSRRHDEEALQAHHDRLQPLGEGGVYELGVKIARADACVWTGATRFPAPASLVASGTPACSLPNAAPDRSA